MVAVFHHAPVNAVMLLKMDRLNFKGLARKYQKCQILLRSKFGM